MAAQATVLRRCGKCATCLRPQDKKGCLELQRLRKEQGTVHPCGQCPGCRKRQPCFKPVAYKWTDNSARMKRRQHQQESGEEEEEEQEEEEGSSGSGAADGGGGGWEAVAEEAWEQALVGEGGWPADGGGTQQRPQQRASEAYVGALTHSGNRRFADDFKHLAFTSLAYSLVSARLLFFFLSVQPAAACRACLHAWIGITVMQPTAAAAGTSSASLLAAHVLPCQPLRPDQPPCPPAHLQRTFATRPCRRCGASTSTTSSSCCATTPPAATGSAWRRSRPRCWPPTYVSAVRCACVFLAASARTHLWVLLVFRNKVPAGMPVQPSLSSRYSHPLQRAENLSDRWLGRHPESRARVAEALGAVWLLLQQPGQRAALTYEQTCRLLKQWAVYQVGGWVGALSGGCKAWGWYVRGECLWHVHVRRARLAGKLKRRATWVCLEPRTLMNRIAAPPCPCCTVGAGRQGGSVSGAGTLQPCAGKCPPLLGSTAHLGRSRHGVQVPTPPSLPACLPAHAACTPPPYFQPPGSMASAASTPTITCSRLLPGPCY